MMGRKRIHPLTMASTFAKEEESVKVTMTATMAGPQGVAKPGTVLDVNEQRAKELVDGHYARTYEEQRDARNPHGLQKPPETFER